MPELPEVETIRRQLVPELKSRSIKKVDVRLPKMVRGRLAAYKKNISGSKIINVGRRGKLLVISMANNYSFLIHLKMTGQIIHRRGQKTKAGGHPIKDGAVNLPNKYTHIIWYLSGGGVLYFNDIRQFGFTKLIKTEELENFYNDLKLGPEPLKKQFTMDFFKSLLRRRGGMKVKQLLLDQTAIAGIGNIYAAEACFDARIMPTRRAGSLSSPEALKLYRAIKKILIKAIVAQGTSSQNYVDAHGNPGGYFPKLKVYSRGGQACFRCHTKIKSIKLGGRTTTFCPQCQK